MSYKPDKHELIDFIYGEVDSAKKQKIKSYLDENPDEMRELEALKDVRTIMGSFPDEEVIEPVVIMGRNSRWDVWKKYIAIAATISVVLLLSLLLDVRVGTSNNALSISMGPVNQQQIEQSSVPQEWFARQDSLYRYISNLENRIESEKKDEVANPGLSSSDAQRIVREALNEYRKDNRNAIADLVSQSEEQQKEFIQGLFIAFAREIEYQREEDLRLINAGFQTLKDETDLKYREAELLMSALQNNDEITQNNY